MRGSMNTRLYFNLSDYEMVKKCIEELGGNKEDFITDDVVELGSNIKYIDKVLLWLDTNGIHYEFKAL